MNLIITGDRLKVVKFSAFEASVTMRGQPGSIVVLLCLLVHCAGSLPPPEIVCSTTRFISEWGTLTCECRAPPGVNNPTITWPGHTQSPVLTKRNVTRHDNGTKFTCLMQSNGQNSSTPYALQVAYGPSDDTLVILGPPVLVTDGSVQLTLTCQASDVNPPHLRYTWFGTGVLCDGGNTGSTCSFRPQPLWNDGKDVTCRATNDAGQSVVTVSTVFRLNLTYPPTSKPVITAFPNQVLKTGDNLTCAVTDGKPLVSRVLFHCTNPTLADQPDVSGHSSVSSTVTVNSSNATGSDTVCICSADWEPGKYNVTYNLNTSVTVQIEYNASVSLFTINNSTNTIVANESSHIGATLRCEAVGQPTPDVRLTLSGQEVLNISRNISSGFVVVSHVIPRLTCRDMGSYTCTADNGFQDRTSAEVVVYCEPTLFKNDGDVIPRFQPVVFIVLVIAAAVLDAGCFPVSTEAKRRQQVCVVPWWSLIVLVAAAALFVVVAVIVAVVSEGQFPVAAFALLIPAAALQIISLGLVFAGAREGSKGGAVPCGIYVVVSIAVAAVLTAVIVLIVYNDKISMQPISFGVCIGVVIVLDVVVAVLLIVTGFMCRPKSKTGRSNPAYKRNDHQPNLYDSGSDPGYASTNEITTNPLKGQGSATAPTSDRDQFGYSCPRDQIPAGDSQSRKASGAPFYAEAGVGNATVAMRDGENRQPGPHVSTISIAPNGDVYNVVSKRAMGDNTAGVRNKEPAGTRRNDVPLGEDNYDHLTNKVRQTPAAAQGDPQYSHVGQF